jgi:uncharacterized protein (DUF2267 family)
VNYDTFVDRVRARRSLRPHGGRTKRVTVLQYLCDRLTGDEANDLFAQLPYGLKTAVIVSSSAQPFTADEFVSRVAGELDVSPEEAENRIRAVFATIREAVSPGEFDDVLMQLDPEYADLIS